MNKYNIPGVKTYEYTKIYPTENVIFGHDIIIDDFTFIYATAKITIGNYVHIACYSSIAGGGEITISDFVAISHGARILSGTDDFKGWGFGNSTIEEKYRNVTRAPISIGKFSIVGANSVVLPGVTIGEGAMVGANSVVSKNLEPWGIYIHNKRIKERDKNAVLQTYSLFLKDNIE